MSEFRVYSASECGMDGYPLAWHETIKHAVREQAGHRCVRCGHPYRSGEHGNGEWSPCDEQCHHGGPLRYRLVGEDIWRVFESDGPDWPVFALAEGSHLGHPELSAVEAQWRILTTHHLDGMKANLCWWNLVALDQRCHLEIQGRVKMERAFIFEHSGWFKPYAAGFYASKYLGEDLTREEVDARLDELLALERLV